MDNLHYRCKRCNYLWKPMIAQPKCCPECKSRKWNEPRKSFSGPLNAKEGHSEKEE